MGCSCKNKRNASVSKTPTRTTRTASNGKTVVPKNPQKRIIKREIK